MKTILLLGALCLPIMAQDINGVSLVGDVNNPKLLNHSDRTVLAWRIARFDSAGNMLPTDSILASDLTKGIPAGEMEPEIITNKINFSRRGTAASVQLDAVLFADGEVLGPDTMAPEFPALEGFTHQLQDVAEGGKLSRLPVPWSKSSNQVQVGPVLQPHEFIILPCSTAGGCWPIAYYSGDQSFALTYYGTPAGIETQSVGGTAVCGPGSPQQGYGIGDNVNATIFCPVSNVYAVSNEGSRRNDFQPDRIIQSFSIYNPYNNALQNSARFHELCAYAVLPNRGGQGPFGKAVTEYNNRFPCQ